VANGYYRAGGGGLGLTDGVKYLLIWNGIFYLLQHFILAGNIGFIDIQGLVGGRLGAIARLIAQRNGDFSVLLGLVPALVLQKGFVWQPVSYLFLHGGFFHLFFNMFALWLFGSDLERLWGTRRFYEYYFFTGVGAGLLTLILTPREIVPTIGASGAIYGILLAYARYFPERRILLYFLFPIPVRVFVFIIGAIALINSLTQMGSSIAHIAHLGGLVFGWLFLRGYGPAGMWRMIRGGRRRGARVRVIDFTRDDER